MSTSLLPLLYFLIDYVAGHLLDQALGRSARLARKTWQTIKQQRRYPGFVLRTKLINRERELRTIKAAIIATERLQVIYLYGPGGVGKTRLLEEAGLWSTQMRRRGKLSWSGILDLYHADLHSTAVLQSALIENLDPEQHYFQEYRQARVRFEERRRAGLIGATVDAERAALTELFLTEYNTFAGQLRPLIAFDTLENLAHESDLIQQLCQLESMPDAVQSWLLHQAPRLKNTILLLAGRPQPVLQEALAQTYGKQPGQFEAIELQGLTCEDFRQLATALLKNVPPSVQALGDFMDHLWQLTDGRPVHLALVIELAAQGATFTTTLVEQHQNVLLWGQHLVKTLFNYDDDEGRFFFFLALARRGLDAELLHYLEPGWALVDCTRRLTKAQQLSIVKVRPGREELFLHDLLYELFDAFALPQSDLQPWRARLADYYRLRQVNETDRATWAKVTVSLLHYELQLNPQRAFEQGYRHWNEIALKGYEIGLDMQLRDELLRFWHSPTNQQLALTYGLARHQIDLDSAVRWIKRFLMRQRRQQAIDVAETLLAFGPPHLAALMANPTARFAALPTPLVTAATTLFTQANAFFWGHLLTYYGEALTYTGAVMSQVQHIFAQALQLLEASTTLNGADWLQQRVIGRAHNTLGYLLRTHGHYGSALTAYQRALVYFNTADSADEYADTLNNIAFVLALLGDITQAQTAIDQAVVMRQRLGQRYALALSHNTRGRIYMLRNQLEMSRRDCEWALLEFEDLEEARGQGLACIALGNTLRLQGSFAVNGKAQYNAAIEFYQKGEELLHRAIAIFSNQVKEPLRLWEAHNELGSLLREWGIALQKQGQERFTETKLGEAIKAHEQALAVTRSHSLFFQEADTCDDLAHVWTVCNNLEVAQQWLNRMFALVPATYMLKDGQGFQDAPAPGDAYWLILGKIHWRQLLWSLPSIEQAALSKRQRSEAVRTAIHHLVLAYVYFDRYCTGTQALEARLKNITPHLVRLGLLTPQSQRQMNKVAGQYKINVQPLWKNLTHVPTINESPARSGSWKSTVVL